MAKTIQFIIIKHYGSFGYILDISSNVSISHVCPTAKELTITLLPDVFVTLQLSPIHSNIFSPFSQL